MASTYKERLRAKSQFKATETVQEEDPTLEAATQKKIQKKSGTPKRLPTVATYESSIETEEIGPQKTKSGDSPIALTKAQKSEFKKENPQYYDSAGEFKGGSIPDDNLEAFGTPEHSLGGPTASFWSPGGKKSELDEDRFIRKVEGKKVEQKQFTEALVGGAVGFVPVWGTVYHWDDMSPNQKAVSVLLDGVDVLTIYKGFTFGGKFRMASGINKARKAADDMLITNMKVANQNLTGNTAITVAAIKKANAQGMYANAVIELNQLDKGLAVWRGTGSGKTTRAEVVAKLNKTGNTLEETTEVLNKEIKKFEQGKPKDIQYETTRPTGAETVKDTRTQINSLLDETNEISRAEKNLGTRKEAIEVGLAKGLNNNDKALQIIKGAEGLTDLQKARVDKINTLKTRIKRASNELQETQNMGGQTKGYADEITALQKDIVSYSKTDFNATDTMYKTMRDAVKTFPKDRSLWSPQMVRAAEVTKSLKGTRGNAFKEMATIWQKGDGPSSRYDGGFDTSTPTKPKLDIPPGETAVKPVTKTTVTNVKGVYGLNPISPPKSQGAPLSQAEIAAAYFGPGAPASAAAVKAETKGTTKPATKPTTKPFDIPYTPPGPEPIPDDEKVPGPKPGSKPFTEPGPTPGSFPGPKPGSTPFTEPGPKPGSSPFTEPGPTPGSSPEPGSSPGTGSKPETTTASKAQESTANFFAPMAFQQAEAVAVRQPSKPAVQTQTLAPTGATPTTKATPRAKGPGFQLPGNKTLAPGQYPEIVEHEQGAVDIQTNLVTGDRKYFARAKPSRRSPRETLKVISTSPVKPKKQNWIQGVFRMNVTSNSLSFARHRGG